MLSNEARNVELVVVPPGGVYDVCSEFTGRCVVSGIHFYFESGDELPRRVPSGLSGVKAIVIEDDEFDSNAEAIARYEAAGARTYRMCRERLANVPNTTLAWQGELTFHAICFDAGLTLGNPAARPMLQRRDEDVLMRQLGDQIIKNEIVQWYDAPRYQWESMLDAHEVTGDNRYLAAAQKQMLHAIEAVPNDLSNCDCVAPLIPALRLYELTLDRRLLDYSISKFDEYLRITPVCEGCLVNFAAYRNSVRSEILWQVLPGLVLLAHVTGNKMYSTFALEEFQRLHGLLFDTEQSLWSHGYANGRRSAGFWARGVAFGFLGNLGVLELTDQSDPRYELCRRAFVDGAKRLRELQDASGYWCCVPQEPGSGKESSGTAWICAGMGRAMRLGILDSSFRACADRAWDAVKCRIWRGSFPGHMTATTASLQPEYYRKKMLSETGWAHFAMRPLIERKRTAASTR